MMPAEIQYFPNDATPLFRFDIKRVVSIIRSMKIEKDAPDALHFIHVFAERPQFVLVQAIDRIVDVERRMRRRLNVSEYPVE